MLCKTRGAGKSGAAGSGEPEGDVDDPPGDPTRPGTKLVLPNTGLPMSTDTEEIDGTFGGLSRGPSWEDMRTVRDPSNPEEKHPSPTLLVPEEESRNLGAGCSSTRQTGPPEESPKVSTEPGKCPDATPTLTGESETLETERPL